MRRLHLISSYKQALTQIGRGFCLSCVYAVVRPGILHQRGMWCNGQSVESYQCRCLRAVSSPDWCKIFRAISCFSRINIGTFFRCCVLGQGTLPSHASLASGVNEYDTQTWQCVQRVKCTEMSAGLYASHDVEITHDCTGPVTRGVKFKIGMN